MPRARLLFFLLFLPVPLFAADVAVRAGVAGTPFYGQPNELRIEVTNLGPGRATSVVLTANVESDDPRCVSTSDGVRCELSSLGEHQTLEIRARHLHQGNVGTSARIEANVTTTAADADPSNNQFVLHFMPVYPPAEVVTQIRFADALNEDGTLTIRYDIRNQHVEFPATLIANISIPDAAEVVRTNADCGGTPADLVCTLAVPASTTFPLDVTVRLPEPPGRITTKLQVLWDGFPGVAHAEESFHVYRRKFIVTSSADNGPASLRAAIIDANARCHGDAPCQIAFAIDEPLPAEGWFTIRVRTPLPAITAQITTLDATTQPDTNPLGPEVFLDGSALRSGNGFEIAGRANTVSGFAIGNFPDNGVYGMGAGIVSDFIGVDPTGTRAAPNDRGIMINAGAAGIRNNVIGGNRHSGVFAWNVDRVEVLESRIGVAAASDDPIPNGASGVFVGGTPGQYGQFGVLRSVIANNGHFGIAYPYAVWGYVGINRIANNGLGGIDINLDGPSPDVEPLPVITRAYWDGMATVIEGTTPPQTFGQISQRYEVLLYANETLEADGYAEGERHFGIVEADPFGRFTLRYSGDLRGLYVNGMIIRRMNFFGEYEQARTSEFGKAIAVTDQP